MAVTYNYITEIGDSFIIKPGTPIVGVELVFDFVDNVEGVTANRFFNREFRYSNDGLTYTDWQAITPGNLQNINIFNNQIFDIEYRYTRAGSDPTGSLIFNSCSLRIIYTPIENPDSYDESFFADFFDFNDPDVLKWAINVLGKVYEKGIVPDFVERTEDYKIFFGIITHWFSIVVNYARLYRKIENRYDLLYEFLRQRGIVLSDSHTKEDMDVFMDEIFNIFLLRATKLKGNNEVHRLINHNENRVFISSLLEDNKRGWNVNSCSPLYKGIGRTLNTTIGFEDVYGIRELENYPIPSSDLVYCSIFFDGEVDVLRIHSPLQYRGIEANISHKMIIDPNITWEIEAIVKVVGASVDTPLVRFGCKMYDSDDGQVDTFSIDTGVADNSEGNFVEDAVLALDQKTVLRGIIYRFDEELMSSDDSKLNIGQGKNLRTSVAARSLSVTLKFKGVLRSLYIYDLKIRPATLKAPISFVSLINPIVCWLENKNTKLSKIQVLQEMIEKFTPYNSNFLPIWIDEIGETEFIPLTITQVVKENISCNALNDGTILIYVSGGKPPYEYSLNDLPYQFGNNFEGLSDGNYIPKVKDADGVVAIGTNVIISRPPIIVLDDVNPVDVSIYNGNDGSITVFASGGTQPLIYGLKKGTSSWSPYQASNVFPNLDHGIYRVRVSDAKGCPAVESGDIELTQPAGLQITSVVKTNVTCQGLTDGTITINTIQGEIPIQYKLNAGGVWQTSNVFTGLAGGTYVPYAKDATGYQVQDDMVVVNIPTSIVVQEVNVQDATTYGGNDGSIFVRVWGGIGTKEVSIRSFLGEWSPWYETVDNRYTFENLTAGRYDLRVRDENGCILNYPTRIDVGQPAQTTTQPPLRPIRLVKVGNGAANVDQHYWVGNAFYIGSGNVWTAYPGSTVELRAVDNPPSGYFRKWIYPMGHTYSWDYVAYFTVPNDGSLDEIRIEVEFSDMSQ